MSNASSIQKPGVTATRNPLKPNETLLFYCSSDQQIEMDRYKDKPSQDKGGDFLTRPKCPPIPQVSPLVANPGQFAAMLYDNLSCVYGIRVDGLVALLSPAMDAFYGTAKTGDSGLACCGDGQYQGWLYYASDDTCGTKKLVEYNLPQGEPTVDLNPSIDIADGTYLAAYYDPDTNGGTRCCIYQTPNPNNQSDGNRLNYYQYSEQSGAQRGQITNTNNALPNTPMAIVCHNQMVYLYFLVAGRNNIVRVSRKAGDSWASSGSTQLPITADPNLQLTAVALPDNKIIRLFQENPTGKPEKFFQWDDKNIPQPQ